MKAKLYGNRLLISRRRSHNNNFTDFNLLECSLPIANDMTLIGALETHLQNEARSTRASSDEL